MRTYKTVATPAGTLGIPIFEFREDGERDRCVVNLSPGGRPDAIDVVEALQRAHEGGREDRSEEILGDAGLGRAADEAALHELHGFVDGPVLAVMIMCKCRRFKGTSVADWQRHLAYEILQAAARLP